MHCQHCQCDETPTITPPGEEARCPRCGALAADPRGADLRAVPADPTCGPEPDHAPRQEPIAPRFPKSPELLLVELWDIGQQLRDIRHSAQLCIRDEDHANGERPVADASTGPTQAVADDDEDFKSFSATISTAAHGGAIRRGATALLFYAGVAASACGLSLAAWGWWTARGPLMAVATPCLLLGLAAILASVAIGPSESKAAGRRPDRTPTRIERPIVESPKTLLPLDRSEREPLAEVDEALRQWRRTAA